MNPSTVIPSISNSLTELDKILSSGNPSFTSPEWQQLFALRKHLDDQQRDLIMKVIQADDAIFDAAALSLKKATTDLDTAIAEQETIDGIINIVAQVAAAADAVLKAV